MLQRLGQLRVRPRPGWTASRRAMLSFRPPDGEAPAAMVTPPVRRITVAPVLLWLFTRVMSPETGRAEKSVQRFRFKTIVEIRQKGSPV